ncbi:type II toxin-antitoxin system RelE/ParE family toxin [bacterium]|nr:type II toxin-antitoxin system RelE/ParE family toxin [bacterium]
MNYTLRFLPEIEDDLFNAYSWYESKSKGLGEEFIRLFYALSSEISRNPLMYQKIHGEIRRKLLRRFPYGIYFITVDDIVKIVGLFNCARNPKTTFKKLRDRHKASI